MVHLKQRYCCKVNTLRKLRPPKITETPRNDLLK